MKVDTLEQLSAAFGEWRRERAHPRAAVPDELLSRARRAAKVHGEAKVVQSAKLDRRRLVGVAAEPREDKPPLAPAYSRVELGPVPATRAFAELELPNGTKLRLYSQTREALDLLSAVCGAAR